MKFFIGKKVIQILLTFTGIKINTQIKNQYMTWTRFAFFAQKFAKRSCFSIYEPNKKLKLFKNEQRFFLLTKLSDKDMKSQNSESQLISMENNPTCCQARVLEE